MDLRRKLAILADAAKYDASCASSAARGLTGASVKVGEARGRPIPLTERETLLVTVHPSYLLRLQGKDIKRGEWRAFLADLTLAKTLMGTA